ncbi:Bacteriophage holin of superfamily 6 (Holin_LLH) [Paenibacillus sp. UNCCL117]|uniref:phage holin, LLH family n=1 Tax=unclassified Paenibacillus TaxID=185978 RepID=UPI000889989B|nr:MULTISPECIES: phage holin, LLH family [unclassified Paenibacillus]SDD29253.1 Bacteriophage holin of superfamily 6 (Holin_LLH) [Paenibacillus sp. cl123]SFW40757.1 Bacteriophage holin of superfamily 6 (Holin_LLH) [Paenibacillus sp. UNCCL117]
MMSQQITEILTPLVLAVLTALVSVAAVAINAAKDHAINWLKARTNAAQQEIIGKVAVEAMAYVETLADMYQGRQKLEEAVSYAANELQARGIAVSREKLIGTIQKAWMDYNKPKEFVVEEKQ